jgi:hypothetical protein
MWTISTRQYPNVVSSKLSILDISVHPKSLFGYMKPLWIGVDWAEINSIQVKISLNPCQSTCDRINGTSPKTDSIPVVHNSVSCVVLVVPHRHILEAFETCRYTLSDAITMLSLIRPCQLQDWVGVVFHLSSSGLSVILLDIIHQQVITVIFFVSCRPWEI